MKSALPTLLSAILIGCTAEPPRQQVATVAIGGAKDCIPLDQVVGRRAEPPNSVMFEVAGPLNYRNDLIGNCPALARLGPAASIEFENPMGRQLCRNDRIRLFDPIEAKVTGILSAPLCRLGSFVPVPRR